MLKKLKTVLKKYKQDLTEQLQGSLTNLTLALRLSLSGILLKSKMLFFDPIMDLKRSFYQLLKRMCSMVGLQEEAKVSHCLLILSVIVIMVIIVGFYLDALSMNLLNL